jgi:hypothetical protein
MSPVQHQSAIWGAPSIEAIMPIGLGGVLCWKNIEKEERLGRSKFGAYRHEDTAVDFVIPHECVLTTYVVTTANFSECSKIGLTWLSSRLKGIGTRGQ